MGQVKKSSTRRSSCIGVGHVILSCDRITKLPVKASASPAVTRHSGTLPGTCLPARPARARPRPHASRQRTPERSASSLSPPSTIQAGAGAEQARSTITFSRCAGRVAESAGSRPARRFGPPARTPPKRRWPNSRQIEVVCGLASSPVNSCSVTTMLISKPYQPSWVHSAKECGLA